ncbi:MAG: YbaB/EbfC family nucleoid-associated protein [Burkholderiales bacterium]|nr:YbaB/EbfC family nucleoid-associated protein [Burkholderiales bacterium]
MGQMGQMMKQAQMLQNNLKKAQQVLETVEVTGEAGSGAVKITMTCKNVCKKVEIDASLLGSEEDKEMIEDLITAALNDVQKKVDAEVEKTMSAATGGMKLPF